MVNVEAVGLAYEWATKIITVALLMMGPAWLCERFLGRSIWTLVALAVGVVAGFVYLLWLTGVISSEQQSSERLKQQRLKQQSEAEDGNRSDGAGDSE